MKEYGAQDTNEVVRISKELVTSGDMSKIWRPWLDCSSKRKSCEATPAQMRRCRYEPYRSDSGSTFTGHARQHSAQDVINTFKHPVRLYWTKAAYDYMYDSGEALLRNFPVQATIQIAENYDSSDEEEEEEEENDHELSDHEDKK